MSNTIRNKAVIAAVGLVGIALVAVLVGLTTVAIANAATNNFSRNLKLGMSGTDVMDLQKMLNASADTQIATSGAGSPGNESSYFGAKTKAAVIKWQNKYASEVLTPAGLTSGTGFFGALSRSKANGAVATTPTTGTTGTTGTVPTTGGALSVGAATQPANGLLVEGAARTPFTNITLTAGAADVTVSGITVERAGQAVDAVIAGVVLLDSDGTQIGIAKTLNSNHQVTVGDPFVVKAGTSRTVTIAANSPSGSTSLDNYAGQVVALQVDAVNTNGTVSGSLPIVGAMHTVNATLVIGTANGLTSSYNPTAQSKDIGTTGYKFSAIRLEAGSAEDIRLRGIRFYQAGSAASGDIANVQISVDGTAYPTSVSSDGKYYSANFGSGIVISKGMAKDIWIAGDIVGTGASSRSIDFDIQKNTDVYVTGEIFGRGITPGVNITTNTPSVDGVITTISAGTITSVSKSNTVAADNIGVNISNQVLGGYDVEMKGEPISVQSQVFHITNTGTQTLLTSVALYGPNGSVVAGPVDAVAEAGTNQKVTFTDTVTYPVGKSTYVLKGKVASGTTNGVTFQASTTPSTDWGTATGQTSGTTVSRAGFSSAVAMNAQTVRSGAIAFGVLSQPTARQVIAGAKGFEFARYNLDASQSGEDVRLTSFKALLAVGGSVVAGNLSSCNLYDGTTNVSGDSAVTVAAGDNNFIFNGGGLVITKGTQKTLSMKCDLSAGTAAGNIQWGLTNNSDTYAGATGVASGQTVAETMTAAAGQIMTRSAGGTYTVTQDSSLLYTTAQAGTSGVTLAKFRFTAGAAEAVNLQQVALQLGNTASNSPADLANQSVTIWNGATQVGTASFGGANPDNATSTILSPAPQIAAGDSVVLTIKGNLSAQDINQGTPGAFLAVTYDGDNNGINGNYAKGVDSQTNIPGTSGDITTNGVRIYRTVPSFAITSTGGSLTNGGDLYKVTVSNGNTRDVVLEKMSFSIATTGGAATGFTLYGDGIAAKAATTETAGVTGAQTLSIVFDQTSQAKIVPANSSKTYTLRVATVVDTASVSETVSVALLADTSFPAQLNLMNTVGGLSTSNLIWSPFSTTTPVADAASESNLDWANGYGLPGFPSNGNFPIQTWTRSN